MRSRIKKTERFGIIQEINWFRVARYEVVPQLKNMETDIQFRVPLFAVSSGNTYSSKLRKCR